MRFIEYFKHIVLRKTHALQHIKGVRSIVLEYAAGKQEVDIRYCQRAVNRRQHILLMLGCYIAHDIFAVHNFVIGDNHVLFHNLKPKGYGQFKRVVVNQPVCIAFYYFGPHVFPSVNKKYKAACISSLYTIIVSQNLFIINSLCRKRFLPANVNKMIFGVLVIFNEIS